MRFPLRDKPLWVRGAVLALAATIVAGLAVVGFQRYAGLPDDAAFSYDGTVVTEAELADRVDALQALYGIQEPTAGKEREQFRRDVAKAVAVSMVLDDAAEEHDIVIADKTARDTLSSMIEGQLGEDPQGAFTDILAEFGVSEADVLREIKRQQAVARLFQDVTREAAESVTPEKARAYFEQDPARFAVPEQRQLRNIVVATSQDAQGVADAARAGKEFGGLARRASLDDATRDKGGDLGVLAAAQLEPSFAKVAFDAGQGEVFGPVQTQYGWNVGQVVRVIQRSEPAYDAVAPQVAETLRSELALEAWRDWLKEQIADADVEYADGYRPADPDELPTDTGLVPDPGNPTGRPQPTDETQPTDEPRAGRCSPPSWPRPSCCSAGGGWPTLPSWLPAARPSDAPRRSAACAGGQGPAWSSGRSSRCCPPSSRWGP